MDDITGGGLFEAVRNFRQPEPEMPAPDVSMQSTGQQPNLSLLAGNAGVSGLQQVAAAEKKEKSKGFLRRLLTNYLSVVSGEPTDYQRSVRDATLEMQQQRLGLEERNVRVNEKNAEGLDAQRDALEAQRRDQIRRQQPAAISPEVAKFLGDLPSSIKLTQGGLEDAIQDAVKERVKGMVGMNKKDMNVSEVELALRAEQGDQQAAAAFDRIQRSRIQRLSVTVNANANKPLSPADRVRLEGSVRDDYMQTLKAYKIPGLEQAATTINSLANQAMSGSPAAVDGLIIAYNKMLDEGSVVRESEFARTTELGSIMQRVEAKYGHLAAGTRLTPEQIQDLKSASLGIAESVRKVRRQVDESYKGIAERSGLDSRNVLAAPGGTEPANISTGTIRTSKRTGKRERWDGSQWQPVP